MKKLLILSAALFIVINVSNATIRTVSNSPSGGAQYSTLQAAYSDAASGDTLLVEGTNINYNEPSLGCSSNINWDKSLTVIGMGFNPQKQTPRLTLFFGRSGCADSDFFITSGGNGSKFYGIVFLNPVKLMSAVTNLTFEDCKFNGAFNFNNQSGNPILFRNCIFDQDNNISVTFPSSASCVTQFENCVFDGSINGNNNIIANTTINHCLFLKTSTESLQNLKAPIVSNCIFMNYGTVANSSSVDGIYMNNIARLASTLPPTGNSGSGNLPLTNPNFVSYSPGTFYSIAHDYALQSGSPAIGAGSDMTDVGVHGGTSIFSETGEVLIVPIVRAMQINNTSVLPAGTLNVQVQAGKPNTD